MGIWIGDKSQLEEGETLTLLKLYFNLQYGLLACKSCGFVLNANWDAHLLRYHKVAVTPQQKMISELQDAHPLQAIQEYPEPIQGLPLLRGWECQRCDDHPALALKPTTLKSHHYVNHEGESVFANVSLQRLSRTTKLFKVNIRSLAAFCCLMLCLFLVPCAP